MLPTMYESLHNTLFHLSVPFLKDIIFYMYFFSLASYHSLYFWGVSMLMFVGIVHSFLLPLVIYSLFCWWIFGFYFFVFMNIASITSLVSIHVSWYVLGRMSCKHFSENLFLLTHVLPGAVEERSGISFQCQCLELSDITFFEDLECIIWCFQLVFFLPLTKLHIFSYTYRLFMLALLWDAY